MPTSRKACEVHVAIALAAALRWAGPPPTPQSASRADAAASDAGEGLAHGISVAARLGNPGYGGAVGYRLRLARGVQVGLEVEGVFAPEAFIGGLATERNAVVAGRVPLLVPVLRTRRLTMALALVPGVRATRSYRSGPAEADGLSVTLHIGAFAYLRAAPRLTWMAGVDNPVSIQVDPIVDVDQLGTLLVTGPVVPISDRWSWFATVEAGGIFGSDGDAGKFLVRGTTGLRLVFGASARSWRAF